MSVSVRSILEHKGYQVHTVEPGETVLDAVGRMNRYSIGALVVVRHGVAVGIFTERDVLTRVVAQELDPRSTRVVEVMTEDLVVVELDTQIEEAMRLVTERRCRHLPVVDDGVLAGMISAGDLTRSIVEDREHRIDDLVGYITAG